MTMENKEDPEMDDQIKELCDEQKRQERNSHCISSSGSESQCPKSWAGDGKRHCELYGTWIEGRCGDCHDDSIQNADWFSIDDTK